MEGKGVWKSFAAFHNWTWQLFSIVKSLLVKWKDYNWLFVIVYNNIKIIWKFTIITLYGTYSSLLGSSGFCGVLFMYVRQCVCVCVLFVYLSVSVSVSVTVSVYVSVCMSVCMVVLVFCMLYVCMSVCMSVCMCVCACLYAWVYVYMHVCIHVCMSICMYMHVCVHGARNN